MTKILTRVKNTEKLIESLKCEYNESLRELTIYINSFKDFILGIYHIYFYYQLLNNKIKS